MRVDADRRPKRVLMTADAVGGVWTYALELARALRPFDVEIVLATMGDPPNASKQRAARALDNVVLHVSEYRLEWMQEAWEDVEAAGEWLLGLEDRYAPDVVHLNGYVHAALDWRAPVLVVGHSCVASWFACVRGEAPPASFDRYRQEVARGLAAADLVTAPTHTMLDWLRRHYGPFRAGPAVANGRAAAAFRPQPKEPIVLTAGRLWDEAKNVATLARAAAEMPWPVYVAGEQRHPENGGTVQFDGVRLLGTLDPEELGAWMGRAAVYALPARYEPFGLTPVEAALAGCALLLADIPTLREVWCESALFVPPDDAAAWAEAVRRLAADERERERLAEAARRRAACFTPDQMAASYVRLYEALLRGRPFPVDGGCDHETPWRQARRPRRAAVSNARSALTEIP